MVYWDTTAQGTVRSDTAVNANVPEPSSSPLTTDIEFVPGPGDKDIKRGKGTYTVTIAFVETGNSLDTYQ